MEKYCNNCGNKGHLYRNCRHPILSYGIFIYTKGKNGEYETILVERKDSLAYIEFLRGKYKYIRNKAYIQLLSTFLKFKIYTFIKTRYCRNKSF